MNTSSFNNNSGRVSFSHVKHSSRNSGRFSQASFLLNPSRGSLEEPRCNLKFTSNTTTDSLDDVFLDSARRSSLVESSLGTEATRSDIDISSDTCTRLEVLDDQVKLRSDYSLLK